MRHSIFKFGSTPMDDFRFDSVDFVVLKSQVGLLQTAHSWANAGVLLGGHMRRGSCRNIKLSG